MRPSPIDNTPRQPPPFGSRRTANSQNDAPLQRPQAGVRDIFRLAQGRGEQLAVAEADLEARDSIRRVAVSWTRALSRSTSYTSSFGAVHLTSAVSPAPTFPRIADHRHRGHRLADEGRGESDIAVSANAESTDLLGFQQVGDLGINPGDSGVTDWLGVKPSYSRARVSDDNAYADSLFRTALSSPAKGFADLDQARTCEAGFVRWYNFDHGHSGIRNVSSAQRHAGDDLAILTDRHALYLMARELNPARWSGETRDWTPIGAVTLNPERDSIIKTHLAGLDIQTLAA